MIQSAVRVRLARREAAERLAERAESAVTEDAALRLQRAWQGKRGRIMCQAAFLLRDQHRAAVYIQGIWRTKTHWRARRPLLGVVRIEPTLREA